MKAKKVKIKGNTAYHWICPDCKEAIRHGSDFEGKCKCKDKEWERQWSKEKGLEYVLKVDK